MNTTHLHFQFLCFEEVDLQGNAKFPVIVNIIADTELLAKAKVQKICSRKNYYLQLVKECTACFVGQEQTKQLEKLTKHLSKDE